MGNVSMLSMMQQLVSIKFSYNPRSSSTIVSEPGLQSHCREGLALAGALELSSLTSVAPTLNAFKCSRSSGSTRGWRRFVPVLK